MDSIPSKQHIIHDYNLNTGEWRQEGYKFRVILQLQLHIDCSASLSYINLFSGDKNEVNILLILNRIFFLKIKAKKVNKLPFSHRNISNMTL